MCRGASVRTGRLDGASDRRVGGVHPDPLAAAGFVDTSGLVSAQGASPCVAVCG